MRFFKYLMCLTILLVPHLANPAHAKPVSSVVWTSTHCKAPVDGRPAELGIFATILSLVIGSAVEGGITAFGDAITKAGSPKDINSSTSRNVNLYRVSVPAVDDKPVSAQPQFAKGCITMVFGPAAEIVPDVGRVAPRVLSNNFSKANIAPLKQDGTWNSDMLSSIYNSLDEAKTSVLVLGIQPSKDGTAFRLEPQFASIGAGFDGKLKRRELNFTLSLLPPGGAADGAAIATRTVTFKNLTQPKILSAEQAQDKTTSWIPLPALPESVSKRINATNIRLSEVFALKLALKPCQLGAVGRCLFKPEEISKAEADVARLEKLLQKDQEDLQAVAPHTFKFHAKQTRPGSKFLMKLGQFLSDNAEKIGKPIVSQIDPTARAAAIEAETQKVETLRITAVTEAAALAKATTEGDTAASRVATIKLGAACRQIEAAGFSDTACLVIP